MEKKKALITGITGQDGSYLAEFLLKKEYEVHGIVRRTSTFNRERIEHLTKKDKFFEGPEGPILHYGDLTDSSSIKKIIKEIMPDEIYNLGAQSHVGISFEVPENTSDITALGALRLLDAIKDICPKAKFYQASSSEMFGKVAEIPQSEKTPFHPRSPYGCAKTFAFYITVNYREAYGLHASNGILFNHESERRGENFVTRKITQTLAKIKLGLADHLFLGNLDAKRDWGHAEDAVEAMWLILQQDEPDDYVIGTGETHSVREFLEEAAKVLEINIKSNGKKGREEEYIDEAGRPIVKIDPEYFRPTEVDFLCADPTKAKTKLGWEPKTKFKQLVKRMAEYDLKLVQEKAYLNGKEKDAGKKIAAAIKPLLEFAEQYGIRLPSEKKDYDRKKVVAVSGYFDPFHIGHVEYFKLAKELAGPNGKLVVILNNDKQARIKKDKSFMPLEERKAILKTVDYIDEILVSIDNDETVCKTLEILRPDIFAKGGDRYANEIPESEICRKLNIQIVDGLGKKIQSSSDLLRKYNDR